MHVFLFPTFIVLVAIAGVVGWIMNVVKIVASLGDPTVTPMFIARIVGALAPPIGAVLGFF